MSLILDALSRAEREKRAHDGVPDILAPVEAPKHSRRLPAVALLLAALAIVAVLGVIAYWQWSGQDTVQNQASSRGGNSGRKATSVDAAEDALRASGAVERSAAQTSTPAPSSIPTPSQTPNPARAVADRERIAALYSTRASGAVEGGLEPETAAAQPAAAGSAAPQAVASATPASPQAAQASATRSETPVDLEQVLREVRRASANDSLSEHPVPVLESLSQQFRDRVPTLMYLRHDYAGDQGSSSVLINGESLRVGQRTRSVQVVEILPDSVILRFDGRDFRLRALNSWINL